MKTKTKATKFSESVIGVDLGDRMHSICVLDQAGNVLEESTIPNTRDSLDKLAQNYPASMVALEVGTHSPWISRHLQEAGMEVIVANARKVRAIHQNQRKCDRADAAMLARLARVDPELLHPVQHGSEAVQRELVSLKLRANLVRQRTSIITGIRGCLKSIGHRIPGCSAACFPRKAREAMSGDQAALASIEPALQALDSMNLQIAEYDARIREAATLRHPQALVFQQLEGLGPITSLAFTLIVEDPWRFEKTRDVGPWLGLVPGRDQSGKIDKELGITKCGNVMLRTLLVQCAQYILGHFGPDCELRRHGLKLVARGGKAAKRKATVAVARKLAVMMIAMWKNGTDYNPEHSQAA